MSLHKIHQMRIKSGFKIIILSVILFPALIIIGCDYYKPKKSFRFAIPENDYIYGYMFSHIKPLLEQNGYSISVVSAERNIEANQLVAEGKADLTFVNNVSSHIAEALGSKSTELRNVLPLAQRALLGFSREETKGPQSARQIFKNKTIGVEILNGEGHGNISTMLERARIDFLKIVQSDQADYDVRLIWGSSYGKRALEMLDTGWHAISFDSEWIDFQNLTDPALEPITLPALPGDSNSITVQTLATTAVLVANKDVGENAIYQLAETIMQGRLSLIRADPTYHSISESINRETLLYPLHEGTSSYLRRDTPTFLERYADSLALVISVIVLLYGGIQAIKNYIRQVKKDRIDEYFLEFLDIRSQNISDSEQIHKLNDLFQRALLQMTNEKMNKDDFDIFSRLIQQELTNLQLHTQ